MLIVFIVPDTGGNGFVGSGAGFVLEIGPWKVTATEQAKSPDGIITEGSAARGRQPSTNELMQKERRRFLLINRL
jgi:hypothetical protein